MNNFPFPFQTQNVWVLAETKQGRNRFTHKSISFRINEFFGFLKESRIWSPWPWNLKARRCPMRSPYKTQTTVIKKNHLEFGGKRKPQIDRSSANRANKYINTYNSHENRESPSIKGRLQFLPKWRFSRENEKVLSAEVPEKLIEIIIVSPCWMRRSSISTYGWLLYQTPIQYY